MGEFLKCPFPRTELRQCPNPFIEVPESSRGFTNTPPINAVQDFAGSVNCLKQLCCVVLLLYLETFAGSGKTSNRIQKHDTQNCANIETTTPKPLNHKGFTLRVQVPNSHILPPTPILQLLIPKSQVPNYWVLGPSWLFLSGVSFISLIVQVLLLEV